MPFAITIITFEFLAIITLQNYLITTNLYASLWIMIQTHNFYFRSDICWVFLVFFFSNQIWWYEIFCIPLMNIIYSFFLLNLNINIYKNFLGMYNTVNNITLIVNNEIKISKLLYISLLKNVISMDVFY